MHLGGPVWSCNAWLGSLYPADARTPAMLGHYAAVFNAVEGNSTFYGVPSGDTFARWRAATPAGFRFCFKVPRAVTHDAMLVGAEGAWRGFLEASAALGDRAGPTMIQLPPAFDASRLDRLAGFLRGLPEDRPWAVEPRHPDWFGERRAARQFDGLLRDRNVDRVAFDATILHRVRTDDPIVLEAQRRKPRLPPSTIRTGSTPVVRIVVVGDDATLDQQLAPWADRIAGWIDEGALPHVFLHTPDDHDVPAVCARFHGLLSARADVGSMPVWPGRRGGQISLFDRDPT